MNETALKERIKAVAKEKGINFNEVWKQLLLERFLARLSRSKHHEHFIFKGGKIQIDTGIGDAVEPVEDLFRPFEYKGKPIFEGEITLLTYPVETIFAEKLETVVSKGALNSRMKDYHDLILMIREPELLPKPAVKRALPATFQNRGTALKLPIAFDAAQVVALQRLWSAHLAVKCRPQERRPSLRGSFWTHLPHALSPLPEGLPFFLSLFFIY
jgi:hypothetical protein